MEEISLNFEEELCICGHPRSVHSHLRWRCCIRGCRCTGFKRKAKNRNRKVFNPLITVNPMAELTLIKSSELQQYNPSSTSNPGRFTWTQV